MNHQARPSQEWPPLDPTEQVKIRRRYMTPLALTRAMAPVLGSARVVRVRSAREQLMGLSGSRLRKLVLKLSDGRIVAVVLKSSRSAPTMGLLQPEPTFYREIAPLLPIRVPRLMGTVSADTGNDSQVMVLEALATGISSMQLGRSHLARAIALLARMHAHFWNSDLAQRHPWLPDITALDVDRFRADLEHALEVIALRQATLRFFPRLIDSGAHAALERIAHDPAPILAPLSRVARHAAPRRS